MFESFFFTDTLGQSILYYNENWWHVKCFPIQKEKNIHCFNKYVIYENFQIYRGMILNKKYLLYQEICRTINTKFYFKNLRLNYRNTDDMYILQIKSN